MEHLLDIEELTPMLQAGYVHLRPWTLLEPSIHPHAAQLLRHNATTVRWSAPPAASAVDDIDPAASTASASAGASTGFGRAAGEERTGRLLSGAAAPMEAVPMGQPLVPRAEVHVTPGKSDAEWRALVASSSALTHTRLLHLESAEGVVFGGFEDARAGATFDAQWREHVLPGTRRFSGSWCCTQEYYQAGTRSCRRSNRRATARVRAGSGGDLRPTRALVPRRAGTILYKRPFELPKGAAARGGAAAARAADAHAKLPRPCYWMDCQTRARRYPDDI
jgi:hypothetical protein